MPTQQLELNLSSLVAAENAPEQGNIVEMCDEFDQAIAHLDVPLHQKLAVAGNAIARIVGVYDQKANQSLDSWDFAGRPATFPVVGLEDYVRQSMSVGIDDFIQDTRSPRKEKEQVSCPETSIAGVIDQAKAIDFINLLELAGNDTPERWSKEIAVWLDANKSCNSITLSKLCNAIDLAPIEVWIGLLLGRFQPAIELRQEDFYGEVLIVRVDAESLAQVLHN